MKGEHDLIWAVLDNPAAQAPRLAYADWLATDGLDPDRARVVRGPKRVAGRPAEDEYTQELGGLGSGGVRCAAVVSLARSAWRAGYTARLHWSRGFVDRVELPAAAFFTHAADLFAAQPIVGVRLTDKHPVKSDGSEEYTWGECPPSPGWRPAWRRSAGASRMTGGASDLASELFATGLSRAGFATAGRADDALSAACVAYGRQLTGLAAPA